MVLRANSHMRKNMRINTQVSEAEEKKRFTGEGKKKIKLDAERTLVPPGKQSLLCFDQKN